MSSVEEQSESRSDPKAPTLKTETPVAREQPVRQVAPSVPAAAHLAAPVAPPAAVENVDLGKIGSILNSLNSVMKNTGECRWLLKHYNKIYVYFF